MAVAFLFGGCGFDRVTPADDLSVPSDLAELDLSGVDLAGVDLTGPPDVDLAARDLSTPPVCQTFLDGVTLPNRRLARLGRGAGAVNWFNHSCLRRRTLPSARCAWYWSLP